MRTVRYIQHFLGLLVLVMLASCGAGSGTNVAGGVGTGGTGITSGTVVGFGSLVVDGDAYDSATAEYLAGNETEESTQTSSMTTGLGQQVQIQLDNQGNPSSVLIEPTLIGTVSAVNTISNSLVVNGMTVRLNTNPLAGPVTYYSGLASVSVGMRLEVHGPYAVDAGNNPYILATRLSQLPATGTATRLTGVVSNLNPGAQTFSIGAVTVHYDSSTTRLPSGITLSNGQQVNVWSPTALSGGYLNASVIRVRTLSGVTGRATLSGLVTDIGTDRFKVSGIEVDASAASVQPIAATLTLDEYVTVSGQADATTDTLIADSISTITSQPTTVELKGTITDFVNASNFQVRGTVVDASTATISGGTAAQLANDLYVEVQGNIQDDVVKAQSVSISSTLPIDSTVEFSGTVGQLSGSHFVLTLADGQQYGVDIAANVGYENGTAANLVDGVRVEVEATASSSGLIAYGISFLGSVAPTTGTDFEVSGIAYDVTSTTFVVNGLTILINGLPTTGLIDGVEVDVIVSESGGQYYAQSITVDD